ncbi:hypothetical protein TSUD_316550 [Trifolium subterraneum]|uniref:Cyclin C-terminal domain-containing protein n=1 Tax=Trifolium subterraneum TaxID=3900 RepID=A0A2Z6NYF9_TRISU|nr:hypothetical protein TSUD_316550 [Trifolium subterraneum]
MKTRASKKRANTAQQQPQVIVLRRQRVVLGEIPDLSFPQFQPKQKLQVLTMEADVLKSLNFEMGSPNVITFLKRFVGIASKNQKISSLCECLGYESADLEECVTMLHDLYLSRREASFKAVRDKYKQQKFKYVADLPSPPEVPSNYFEEE